MSNRPTIPKTPALLPDQDYASLRQQGQQYLEGMATALWTDFNEHDPGITILEALCYAITELGYRTAFPMADLLTQPDGTMLPGQCFYTPKTILTINPLTIRDYRKFLVDLQGVENAWLESNPAIVGQEVAFYADCDADQLSIDDGKTPAPPDHEIHLSGLYRVTVDLAADPSLGDLNNTNITFRIAGGTLQDQVVTFCFGAFEAMDQATFLDVLKAVTGSNYASVIGGFSVTRTNAQYHWDGMLTVNLSSTQTVSVPVVVRIDSLFLRGDISAATTYLNTVLFSNIDQIHAILVQYQQKITLIAENLLNVRRVLLEHRNLCEDFRDVVTVTDQEVALCMDIDIATEADINEIQAQIFFQVQEYLSPQVRFYSLKDLLAQGLPVDQIFDGPVLTHGFINNTELDQTTLVSVIRTSALVKIIMGIDGVLAVRGVMMTLYDANGEPVLPSQTACVVIPPGCKALLNTDRSKLTFYMGKIPLLADRSQTLDIIRYLQAIQARNKLYGTEDDLPVPTGAYRDPGDYYSVQNDLPRTYGVGIAGLPANALPARQAQALQLKAYLLFFDQLLANFFSQLQGAGRLLSIDSTLVQSYFTQYLAPSAPPYYQDGVKNIDRLYLDPATGVVETAKVASLLGGAEVGSTDWQRLVESEQTFASRRNAFLDHLLSRFAESFSDYALMMYKVDFDLQQTEAQSDPALINAKIRFLDQYPSISRNRGKALDYCPLVVDATTSLPLLDPGTGLPIVHTGLDPAYPQKGGLWNAWNVSGLEKRAALLSGIPLLQGIRYNQYLFSPLMGEVLPVSANGQAPYYYAFYDGQGQARLVSVKQDYTSQTAAQSDLGLLVSTPANPAYYYIQPQGDGTFKLFLTDSTTNPGGTLLATDNVSYADAASASAALAALVQLFTPTGQAAAISVNANNLPPYSFAFRNAQQQPVLISVNDTYGSSAAALADAELLTEYLSDPYYYFVQQPTPGNYRVFLTNDSSTQENPLATDGQSYATAADARAAITALVKYFTFSYNNEGFYLLEHILLRPRAGSPDFQLMEVCLGKDCQFCGEQDPYTFRASVVLPYWIQAFGNLDFRTYFENTIMAEAPAHVSLKICWVNNSSMRQFETAYRTWLSALAGYTADSTDNALRDTFRLANDALIGIIENFHSEYPLAVLHDCNESQTDNVVILGSTVLGTYKN